MGTKVERTFTTLDQVFEELNEFERQYQMPTAQLELAFTKAGVLHETPDFYRWSTLRGVVKRVS